MTQNNNKQTAYGPSTEERSGEQTVSDLQGKPRPTNAIVHCNVLSARLSPTEQTELNRLKQTEQNETD